VCRICGGRGNSKGHLIIDREPKNDDEAPYFKWITLPNESYKWVVDVRSREIKDQNRFVYLSLDDFRYEEDRMDKDAITVRKRNKSNKHLYW
jgi:hypothetical protein